MDHQRRVSGIYELQNGWRIMWMSMKMRRISRPKGRGFHYKYPQQASLCLFDRLSPYTAVNSARLKTYYLLLMWCLAVELKSGGLRSLMIVDSVSIAKTYKMCWLVPRYLLKYIYRTILICLPLSLFQSRSVHCLEVPRYMRMPGRPPYKLPTTSPSI